MTTKSKKRRTSGHPARRAAQLADTELKPAPRCECEHRAGRCRRVARFRVSTLCAVEGCETAVHVTLFCAECMTEVVAHHDDNCGSGHRLRVRAL